VGRPHLGVTRSLLRAIMAPSLKTASRTMRMVGKYLQGGLGGGVVWCGVVWCGVVWCGVVWCGVVWCGVVWCGVVW
jgi:hypothetical protein